MSQHYLDTIIHAYFPHLMEKRRRMAEDRDPHEEKLVLGATQSFELQNGLRAAGFTPALIKALGNPENLAPIKLFLLKRAEIGLTKQVINLSGTPSKPWFPSLAYNVLGPKDFEWNEHVVSLYQSQKQHHATPGSSPVTQGMKGFELRKDLASLRTSIPANQVLADYLGDPNNQDLIPDVWYAYNAIAFWGSGYIDSDGCGLVPMLQYNGRKWLKTVRRVNDTFDSSCAAACIDVPRIPMFKRKLDVWRTVRYGHKSAEDLACELRLAGSIDDEIKDFILPTNRFTVSKTEGEADLVILGPLDFGYSAMPTSLLVDPMFLAEWSAGNLDGQAIELCHREIGPQLHYQFHDDFGLPVRVSDDQPDQFEGNPCRLTIASLPIETRKLPSLYTLRNEGSSRLDMCVYTGDSNDYRRIMDRFVYRLVEKK